MACLLDSSAEPLPENFVGRRTQRRVVIYPGSSARHELLVPNLRGELEAVYVGPGRGCGARFTSTIARISRASSRGV
jgi:hypothetical protein